MFRLITKIYVKLFSQIYTIYRYKHIYKYVPKMVPFLRRSKMGVISSSLPSSTETLTCPRAAKPKHSIVVCIYINDSSNNSNISNVITLNSILKGEANPKNYTILIVTLVITLEMLLKI